MLEVYKKPRIKFMHSSNWREHNIKFYPT